MVGVSPDDAETTRRFCDEHALAQRLLLDPEGAIAKAYGATRLGGWAPNRRLTYVIGRDGRILRAHQAELSVASHGAMLEEALEDLGG